MDHKENTVISFSLEMDSYNAFFSGWDCGHSQKKT